MRPEAAAFYREVYDIVGQIPRGKVLAYGDIAALAGWPRHARMVGRALRDVPEELGLSCHRVVDSNGRTAPGWPEQAALLQAEGVTFRRNGKVDLKRHRWEIGEEGPVTDDGGIRRW